MRLGRASHDEARRRGFSLVELLVVVAVVAVLIGVVLAATARARSRAQAVTCLSNLRQVGVALADYAAKNGGWFFPPRTEDWVWWYRVVPGMETAFTQQLLCPTWEPKEYPVGSGERHSYLLNSHLTLLSLRFHSRSPDRQPPTEWVVAGENRDEAIDCYMDPGDFAKTVDVSKHHGGSNYLFGDYHAEWRKPWVAEAGGLDPWDIPVRPPTLTP